jgi:hypothetical protein
MLSGTHDRSALAPLKWPSEDGVFPAASFLREPRPVVGDTRWLAEDIAYACRENRRTVLVTAANEQIIRLFCSAHVVREIFKNHAIWSSEAKRRVPSEEFLRRYVTEYMPLMRVVPDDGVPESWLSPSERQRLATLALSNTNDFPSVKLALAVRGLFLSKDKRALRAVYGAESELAKHAEWLERLRAGGNAAELERFMDSANRFTALSGYGIFKGAQRAYDAIGPASILLCAVGAYGAWQWLSDPSRQSLRDGFGRFVDFCAELMMQQRAYEQQFDAALPAVPTLRQLAGHTSPDAVLGRACLHALARAPEGHLSAQELAAHVRRELPCADARVRAIMREARSLSEVYHGRWQVGSDYSRALLGTSSRTTAAHQGTVSSGEAQAATP